MTDRYQSDIYKDVNDKLDEIDFKILGCVDTRRDDRDCIEAAMITISKYLNEDKATLRNIGYDVGDRNDASYKLVFEPYLNLLRELYDEFKDLENNGTNHYIRTQENDHLQRLAGRIDNAERLVLINQDVYIAKREIAVGNSYLTYIPVPGKPELTYINTPPICNSNCNTKGEKDKVTISDVLQKSNAEAIKGNTFTIDYSECTNPTLKSLGKKVVDENGKDIRTGKDLQAWEGVKVLSSRYIEAREEYSNSLNNPLYHNGGNVGQLSDQLEENNDVLMDYRTETGDVGFSKFLAGIENIPQYKGCVKILQSCGLYKHFEKLYNKNGSKNAYPVIKFLSATETKLEQIIAKNKTYGFELSTLPIEKTDTGEPGIIQANFQGGKRTIKEVFFYDGKHGKNQGSCIRITQALYNFIDEHDDEVVQYLTQRIREKRDDNKYDNLIIKQKVTTETININKDDSEIQKKLQLKNYGLDQLIRSCESFKNTYTDHQPTELTALIKYLSNLKYDLNNGFNHGKMPTDKERENQYNEISELWINFKDHDQNFALFMKDETAKEYIKNILYAEDKETIEVNIKHLTNGMTVFDNTAGNSAVEDAMFNGMYGEGKEELQVENNEINKCIAKIKKDFTVTYDESGNITSNTTAMDEMLSERDKFNTDIQTLHQRNIKDSEKYQKRSGVFKYLKRKGYIPETAEIDYTGEINEICGKIWTALYQKQELLKSDNRKLTPAKLEERYSQEKYDLQKRSNLSKKEKERLETLEAIEDIGYDSDEVKEIIEDENKKAEKSIKYGDMLYIIGGSLGNYFIEAGNGISGGSEIAKMLNDSKGIGSFDLSDETNEQIAPLVASIIEEVIICAVAMAVGTFTAGVGTAGILAAGRALRIVNLCRKLTTGEKYLNRIATIIRRAKNIKKATIASEFANEWKAGKTLKNLYELGKTASAGGLGGRTKISSMIFEGTGFHISSTMLHNALENKSFTEGLDPTENWKEYIESIAFLGVLKMISGPGGIGSLTQDGIEEIMRSKVNKFFKSLFTGGLSLSSEMLGLSATDQILSIVFDQQFKSITVDEFIHMLGMCLGLRVLGKVTKLIVKDKNKKGEYKIGAKLEDGKRHEFVIDKDLRILIENGEMPQNKEFEKAKAEAIGGKEKDKVEGIKGGKENALEDLRRYEEELGNYLRRQENLKGKEPDIEKIEKIVQDKMRTMAEDIEKGRLDIDFDQTNGTFREFGGFEGFVESLANRGKMDQNFLNNIKLTIDYMTKPIINVGGKEPITRNQYKNNYLGGLGYPEYVVKALERQMVNQRLDNPQYFNSHGYDHTILVDSLIIKVYAGSIGAKESIIKKYGLKDDVAEKLAEKLIRFSAQGHDFGYPEEIGTSKTTHATKGAEVFRRDLMEEVQKWLKSEGVSPENINNICRDIYNSIFFHGADKVEGHYATKVEGIVEGEARGGVLIPESEGNIPIEHRVMGEYQNFENYRVSFKSENSRTLSQKQALELSNGRNSDITIYTENHPEGIKFEKIESESERTKISKEHQKALGKEDIYKNKIAYKNEKGIKVEDLIENEAITRIEGQTAEGKKVSIEIRKETESEINYQVLNEALGRMCDLMIYTDKGKIEYNAETKKFTNESGEEISKETLAKEYKFEEIEALFADGDGAKIKVNYNDYEGRKLDKDGMGGAGLEYKRGDLADDPILSMIGVADNLDMCRNRLIPSQSNAFFLCALNNLEIGEISKIFERMENYNKKRKKYNEYLEKLNKYNKGELKEEPQKVDPPSEEELSGIKEDLPKIFTGESIEISKIFEEVGHETGRREIPTEKRKSKTQFKSYDEKWNPKKEFEFDTYFKDGKFDLAKFKQDLFQSIRDSGKIDSYVGDETLDMSRDLMTEDMIGPISVRHMIGLRTIKNVDFIDGTVRIEIDMDAYFDSDLTVQDGKIRTVEEKVEKEKEIEEDGKKVKVKEKVKVDVPLVEYHVWREGTALDSKSYMGHKIKSFIVDPNGNIIGEIGRDGSVDYSKMLEIEEYRNKYGNSKVIEHRKAKSSEAKTEIPQSQ